MSLSRFRSATEVVHIAGIAGITGGAAVAALATALAGCSDDACGPGDAPDIGLVATSSAGTLSSGAMIGGRNNDCPAQGTPAGVISLTIQGTQSEGGGFVTLCVSRPDLLTTQPQPLVLDNPASTAAEVRLVDLGGMVNGCSFAIDRAQPVTGTASSSGMCGNGSDAAGFALVVEGALTLTRTCGPTIDSVPITLSGRVAVSPQQ